MSPETAVTPRIRVLIDNDFGGDPDGLFQLAHHLLSPSVDIRGIIGSRSGGFFNLDCSAAAACRAADKLMAVMGLAGRVSVYQGAETGLPDTHTPVASRGSEAIVQEAMRDDSDLPLYLCCGAGLTTLASALLAEPKIAQRLTLIWIGGPEYSGAPPHLPHPEYNLGIDITAAQVVFNNSDIPIWQIPRDVYRQALVSYGELLLRVKPQGKIGRYLTDTIEAAMHMACASGLELGETYVLGDSPLVLVTALQSAFDPDSSSSAYTKRPAPSIKDDGSYRDNTAGRTIRVYTRLDTRLMFEDLFIKLSL